MTLESLYSSYANDVYRYLYSLCGQSDVAEDLLQDTFYKAFLYLEDHSIDSVKAWLFKVAYHTFIDYQRKNKRLVLDGTVDEQIATDHHNPEMQYLRCEQYTELLHMIAKLSYSEKQAILLCDLHDLKLHEAAEVLQLNLNTLKTQLYRGRKRLREMLIQKGERDDSQY